MCREGHFSAIGIRAILSGLISPLPMKIDSRIKLVDAADTLNMAKSLKEAELIETTQKPSK